jgi:CubicO group peptidase (beta-lactamase class C family)
MNRFLLLSFLLILISIVGFAQEKKTTSSKAASKRGSSSVTLEITLDSIFSSFNENTPGAAITVIQDGKIIAKKAYGMASLEHKIPFTNQTVARLPYSEGREFISIAAALMEQDDLLRLSDKVQKYFPELPSWSSTVTIQDLLNHSSGFADEWATLAITQASMGNRLDKSQFLQFLYDQPTPSVEPVKGYMYSNSDFGLLRLILEKASGEDLSVYMKRRVFDPLGMVNSKIHNDKEEVIINQALNYGGANNLFRLWLRDKTSPGGNYYVLTSASDLENWAAAYDDSSSFVYAACQRLRKDARPIPVLTGTNYVFGHKVKEVGSYEVTAHMGVNEYAYMARVPDKKLTVILWSNHLAFPRWGMMKNILSKILNVEHKPEPLVNLQQEQVEISQQELESLAGMYKWKEQLTFQSYLPSKRYTPFVAGKGVLRVVYADTDTLDLVQLGKNRFRDPEYPDLFEFSQEHPDSAMKVVVYTYNGPIWHMEKVEPKRPTLKTEELKLLTGKYYSNHLDFYLTIRLNDKNQLVVRRPTVAEKVLEQFPDGEFRLMTDYYREQSSESWVRFHYDNKGVVSYLTITHPRLMHHRFVKVSD